MVTNLTRWGFRLHIGDKTIKIEGEMLVPTTGMTDYLIYRSSINKWDPPFEAEMIDEVTKQTILHTAQTDLSALGWVPEIV
jgi:hypothetical protein